MLLISVVTTSFLNLPSKTRPLKSYLDGREFIGICLSCLSHMHQPRCAGYFRRLLATCCAALVFALVLFAASPILHEQLHHNAHSSSDDGCAVVLFAGGVAMPLAVTAMPPPPAEWREQPYVSSTEIFLDSPRYLLQPERGPPVG